MSILISQVAPVVKNPPANAGNIKDEGSVPGLGRFPRGGIGTPLQYSCLENPMDRGAWGATVHGVAKTWTWLNIWTDWLTDEVFPGGSAGKESACNTGDLSLIPGLGRSSGEGNGYPLKYSGLENSKDFIFHGMTESWTQEWHESDFHFHSRCMRYLDLDILCLRYLSNIQVAVLFGLWLCGS